MRVDVLLKLSQALKEPLTELVATFSSVKLGEENGAPTRESKQYADLEQGTNGYKCRWNNSDRRFGRIPAVEFAGAGVLVTATAATKPRKIPSCQL